MIKYDEDRMSSMQTIKSSKLGDIEYNENDVITLSSPMLGFNHLNDFLLISNNESYPFLWFQSIEDPEVCFILVEALTFFKQYKPSIPKRDLKVLSIEDEKDMQVFCIVVVMSELKNSTANLRAPLVINFEKKLAKQVILEDDTYQIKTPLFE